jgi:glycosyltransferase involved in cell wall biosynthesis
MKDLISIVVPVYNTSVYLNKCIESIINQTYTNLEIILVDDGSTDNSGNICDEYALKDNRISVFHTKNKGQSEARNLGISNSNGECISFIDSDDFVNLDFIEFLYKNMITYNADISCCGFSMYYSNKKNINKNKKNIKISLKSEETMKYLIVNGLISDSPCNKLYEDRRILPVLFNDADCVYYDSTVKYFYRQHKDSTTHNMQKIFQLIDATNERKKYIDYIYPNLKKITTQDLLISYLSVSNIFINNKDKEKYQEMCEKVKNIVANNNYSYNGLKFKKKIQLYIFLHLPKLYYIFISLLKKN